MSSLSGTQRPAAWAIDQASWALWILDFLKRTPALLKFILWATAISVVIGWQFGYMAVLMGWGMIGRFAFMAMYMIAQFLLLFSFLSSTKTITKYPGDTGVVSFEKDYYGNEYLVSAVRDWVDSLSIEGKDKLDRMGAEAINGLLLEGPPGTGKTLLAQCLATDSRAAFFGVSGTDFQAMFIGVGPMKVMRMYSKARGAARRFGAAIVFIDEIDSIGGSRGGVTRSGGMGGVTAGGFWGGGGGLGVLSKLLTELDGVKEVGRREQIINKIRAWFSMPKLRSGLVLTIGATNRFDTLDPALVRPGRIDKIIRVDPPDNNSRRKIIEGYLRKVKNEDIDVERLVYDTQGVTPAQLASAIQRSAPRHATNAGREYLIHNDIDMALQEDLVGLRNPIQDLDEGQRRQFAVHEAGHALVAYLERPERRITHVSIVRRGAGVLGYVRDVEQKETYAMPLAYFRANVKVSLAGHVAVDVVLKQPWTGAAADFQHVRFYMRKLASFGEWGIPFTEGDPLENAYIAGKANEWLQVAIKETYELIKNNRDMLDTLTDALIEKSELTSEEVYAILEGGPDETPGDSEPG